MSTSNREAREALSVAAAAAEDRAMIRAANAAATVQLHLLHAVVPVASSLNVLEVKLWALTELAGHRKRAQVPFAKELAAMESEVHACSTHLRHAAAELGYPLDQEVSRFKKAGAGIATLERMRQAAAAMTEGDLDTWLNDVLDGGGDHE